MVSSIVIIGPGWPLRGGLSAFDEQLARTFTEKNIKARIETFSLQYPSFLFPGTSQYSNDPAPEDVSIHVGINSINPFNWLRIGFKLRKEKPDLIIVRYWIPFLAPCLGSICRYISKFGKIKIIAITDNVIPHEARLGDRILTKFFIKCTDRQ